MLPLPVARAALGRVAIHAGDQVAARYHLTEALSPGLFLPSLEALPAAVLLLAEAGDEERAVELNALTTRYEFVARSRWLEDVAGRRIAVVAETLPAEDVAAARARGQARVLWETVEELLRELSEMEP